MRERDRSGGAPVVREEVDAAPSILQSAQHLEVAPFPRVVRRCVAALMGMGQRRRRVRHERAVSQSRGVLR